MSFCSICATITLLRSPNVLTPHLVSGSLLLPPFTQRSARNYVENNVNRLPQLIPRKTDRTLSFSSICATITLLRSPNASSPHLVSGSLLLPPFTQRSARNCVEKNVNRLPQLIPRRRIGLCRFPRFVSKSWQDDAHGQLVSSRES